MVYKRYIKRGGKTFGPYYYESYRDESGRVKTRYVDPIAKGKKELHRPNLLFKHKNLIIILAIFCLALITILLYLNIRSLTGQVSLEINENYGLNQNLTGEISILIEQGEKIQKDTEIVLRLDKENQTFGEERISFESFFSGILNPIEINETILECQNITNEQIIENCSFVDFFNETVNETRQIEICENQTIQESYENCTNNSIRDYYFNQPGTYSRNIKSFISYTFSEPGNYRLIFFIPLLNVSIEKYLFVEGDETQEDETNRSIGIFSVPGNIGNCQNLDTSGTYNLVSELGAIVGDCFTFTGGVDNITFNGGGNVMTGDNFILSHGFLSELVNYDNITIRGVNISKFGTGITSYGSNWTIINNVISSSIASGIYLASGPIALIQDNFILNSKYGIYFGDIAPGEVFVNNNTISNSTYGFYIVGSQINFTGGVISNSSYAAILIDSLGVGLGRNNIISNVRIENTSSSGFDLVTIDDTDYNTLLDQNIKRYNFTGGGNKLIVKKTNLGQINFLAGINGTGSNFSFDVQIGNNSAFVNSSQFGLNTPANITLLNLPTDFSNPRITHNGVYCSESRGCHNFTSLNAGTVIFNVSTWYPFLLFGEQGGTYSISNDGYCGDGVCTSGDCDPLLSDCRYNNIIKCAEDTYCSWALGECRPDIVDSCVIIEDETNCTQSSFCYYNSTANICRQCGWNAGAPPQCRENTTTTCTPGPTETCSSCPSDCGSCSNPPAGGGSGGSTTPACTDSCSSLGYDCGEHNICGSLTNCGSCSAGEACESGKCVLSCIENWQCSDWSICSGATRNRICSDLTNCGTILNKPIETEECVEIEKPLEEDLLTELGKIESLDFGGISTHSTGGGIGCISNYECSDWSECDVKPVFEDLISGVNEIKGKQSRNCVDNNLCQINKKEERECSIKLRININKSNFCNNDYLEIYNQETGELVSRINNKKQSQNPSLDISFINGKSIYCDSCFNGIMEGGEQGIDCGGICPICDISEEISFSPEETSEGFVIRNKNWVINLLISLLIFILFLVLILLNSKRTEIDDLIFIGKKQIKGKNLDNARKTYLYLKYLYEHKYFGNKEVYNQIGDLYKELMLIESK